MMATKRAYSALLAFFQPGQANGSITPDGVQDSVLSLRPGFGRISLSATVVTDIVTQNAWVKLAGTTALGANAFEFAMPQNGRLQCNSAAPSMLVIEGAVSLNGTSNTNYEVAIAKNGTVLTETAQMVRVPSGGGRVEAFILADFVHAEGDYVELFVRNTSGTSDVTAEALYLRARSYIQ
jgi:hypothetical protein